MNRLCVVIPSKTASNIAPCVKAIRDHEVSIRIIVIDDGVDWAEASRLYADAPASVSGVTLPVEVIPGISPFIFSRACNQGINAAADEDIILMNDDAVLKTPAGFTLLQQCAEAHQDYGIIAPACNNVGNLNQNLQRGGGLRDEPRTLCFTCVLIPRRTIDLVGLLDERYVHYGADDDDACLTVRRAGLKLGIFDGCFIDHHSLTSTYRAPSPTNSSPGDYRPNLKLFIEKWGTDNWGCGRDTSKFADLFPPEPPC